MLDIAAVAGVLASKEHGPTYVTSNLYPLEVVDSFQVNPPDTLHGYYFGVPDENLNVSAPDILEGRIVDTIHYATYTHNETMHLDVPSPIGGTLTHVIDYPVYEHPTESFGVNRINMIEGTLTTVINYVTYNMTTEQIGLGVPAVLAGDLI